MIMRNLIQFSGALKGSIFIFALILCFELQAQDPQFHHFYNNSLLYNPAYTGNTDVGRFSLGYRNQWPGVGKSYVSYTGSYDHYLKEINSGVGIQFIHDKAGEGGLRFTNVNGMFSHQLKLSRKLGLMMGVRAGYVTRAVNTADLLFADQIIRGDGAATVETSIDESINYLDLGTGLVFYNVEKFWLGVSFNHINQPNQSLMNGSSSLPIRSSVQAGWNFKVNKNFAGRSNSTLTLAALYKSQLKWDQLDIGMYYKTSPVIFGLWYRGVPTKENVLDYPNQDAIILMAGFEYEMFSFAYSYDITISKLAGSTHGAHEISIIIEYPESRRRSARYYRIPCPKF